tara:strand:- start:60 stop:548 length:489 start_codon:yes stop_codon:yes gene_type:complete
MVDQEYTLEEISYSRKEDRRIMESVLKSWFTDPKTLNFVSPEFKYPFDFIRWTKLYYKDDISKITTIVLKHNNWVVGHLSISIEEKNSKIFHIFLNQEHRGKGLAIKMLKEIENYGKESGTKSIQASVQKNNHICLKLFTRSGYQNKSSKNSKSTVLVKNFR